MYDKYRDWPARVSSGGLFGVRMAMPGRSGESRGQSRMVSIEQQVIEDLGKVEDEIDKKEILDSYASWAKREYANEISDHIGHLIGQNLTEILSGVGLTMVSKYLPHTRPVHRARPGKVDPSVKIKGDINIGDIGLDKSKDKPTFAGEDQKCA